MHYVGHWTLDSLSQVTLFQALNLSAHRTNCPRQIKKVSDIWTNWTLRRHIELMIDKKLQRFVHCPRPKTTF